MCYRHKSFIRYIICKCCLPFCGLSFCFFEGVFKKYLFTWLHQVLVAACRIFDLYLACRIFSCTRWDLFPWPGIKPGTPTFGSPWRCLLKQKSFKLWWSPNYLFFLLLLVLLVYLVNFALKYNIQKNTPIIKIQLYKFSPTEHTNWTSTEIKK